MLFRNKLPVSWLIVGLGNPGDQYENTRHNVGFLVADELGDRGSFPIQRLKYHALTNTAAIGGQGVLVMKPVTYMNLSGEAVGEAARFYKLPPDHVLVISDDVDLPLGSDQFPRLRVGVGGKPHPDYDMADWVLSKLTGEDKKAMDEAVKRAADAVECLLKEGIDKAMNKYN